MMKYSDEEMYAAMATAEYKAAQAEANEAYNRAAKRFSDAAQKLDDAECARIIKLQERERERERECREKHAALKAKGRQAGIEASATVQHLSILRIVRQMRKAKAK